MGAGIYFHARKESHRRGGSPSAFAFGPVWSPANGNETAPRPIDPNWLDGQAGGRRSARSLRALNGERRQTQEGYESDRTRNGVSARLREPEPEIAPQS